MNREILFQSGHQNSSNIKLTGLDVAYTNAVGTGLLIYNEIPDLVALQSSISSALKRFPSFCGRILYENNIQEISLDNGFLKLKVYETEESLTDEIPPSQHKMVDLFSFNAEESLVISEGSVFRLILLINPKEGSSALIWKSVSCHTDGFGVFRFLQAVADAYNSRKNITHEDLLRTDYIEAMIDGIEAACNKYMFDIKDDYSGGITYDYSKTKGGSSITFFENCFFSDLKKVGINFRNATYANALKTHFQCMQNPDDVYFFRAIDMRNKGLFNQDYSGCAVMGEISVIPKSLLEIGSIIEISQELSKNRNFDYLQAKQAIACHELKKHGKKFQTSGEDFELEQDSRLVTRIPPDKFLFSNDLSDFSVEHIDIAGKPLWYETVTTQPFCIFLIMPAYLSKDRTYIRIYGQEKYISEFIPKFHDNLSSIM